MTHAVAAARTGAPLGVRGPVAVEAHQVGRLAGGRAILERVSFTLVAGELVAVLGPSGAGKSTLIEVLCGITRPDRGQLLVGGLEPAGLQGQVGYVPQHDVAPLQLTLREALEDAAALRAPALLASPVELEARLCALAARLGLSARLDERLGRLSGGERRRASLALELVGDPRLLVVDEVTSGLDAAAERRVIEALRAVADAGTTVVAITHTLATLPLFDRVLLLHGGRLVWDGPLPEALRHFQVAAPEALYARLQARAPEAWAAALGTRVDPRVALAAPPPASALPAGLPGPSGLHQLLPRLRRQLRLTRREGWSLLLLLGQAPLIAALIAFAYDGAAAAGRAELGFKLALAAIWLGCVGSCQELVKERDLYRHERLAGLSRPAYLLAKLTGVALLAAVQGGALGLVVLLLEPGLSAAPLDLLPGLVAAALSGAALGLLVSALVSTRTAAVGLTPLLLVPQILFVGTLAPLSGVAAGLSRLMPSHWAELAVRAALGGRGPAPGEVLVLLGFAAVWALVAAGAVAARDALGRGGR